MGVVSIELQVGELFHKRITLLEYVTIKPRVAAEATAGNGEANHVNTRVYRKLFNAF